MSRDTRKRKRKKGKAEGGGQFVHVWLRTILDYLACAYIIFIMAVLPLYCPDGYTYIASRKNELFGRCSVAIAKVLAVVALLYGIVSLVRYFRSHRELSFKEGIRMLFGKIRGSISAVDRFVLWYGAAVVLSFLCTKYRESALMGAKGWNMGFYTQMVLVCSYFLISKFWKPRKEFFAMLLSISVVVFLLGYLNRFSIYPIKMESANYSFISTIGNINWYCGYVTTVFFGGVALVWQGGSLSGGQGCYQAGKKGGSGGRVGKKGNSPGLWWRILLAVYGFLGFATLVTQGSDSGVLTLGVMLLVLFCLSAGDGERMLGFWKVVLLLSSACLFTCVFRIAAPELMNYRNDTIDFLTTGFFPVTVTLMSCLCLAWIWRLVRKGTYRERGFRILARVIVTVVSCCFVVLAILLVVNTLHPGAIGTLSEYGSFTFSDSWGSNRGATWKCGWKVFMEQDIGHKLVGVGPDAMSAYIYSDGSEELVTIVRNNFGNSRLTNAHNEWLTILADVGVLGLIGYGGLMTAAIGVFLKKGIHNLYVCACGLCLLAYTVNNIFSFQQIMNVPLAFVLLGMGMAFCEEMKIKG